MSHIATQLLHAGPALLLQGNAALAQTVHHEAEVERRSHSFLEGLLKSLMNTRCAAGLISRDLDLMRGGKRFIKTACYGHFGRDDPDFTWETVKKLE